MFWTVSACSSRSAFISNLKLSGVFKSSACTGCGVSVETTEMSVNGWLGSAGWVSLWRIYPKRRRQDINVRTVGHGYFLNLQVLGKFQAQASSALQVFFSFFFFFCSFRDADQNIVCRVITSLRNVRFSLFFYLAVTLVVIPHKSEKTESRLAAWHVTTLQRHQRRDIPAMQAFTRCVFSQEWGSFFRQYVFIFGTFLCTCNQLIDLSQNLLIPAS